MIISSSIMSADIWNFSDQLKEIETIENTWLHIDMMDGYYVENIGFSKRLIEEIKKKTKLFTDIHLMVSDPDRYVQILCPEKVDAITFHIDTEYTQQQNINLIHYLKNQGIKAGITLQCDRDIEMLIPYLDMVDIALVVCTNIGYGAQKFIQASIGKIRKLNHYRQKHDLKYLIEVDGGINELNAQWCREEGADILVSGSYVFRDNKMTEHIALLKG